MAPSAGAGELCSFRAPLGVCGRHARGNWRRTRSAADRPGGRRRTNSPGPAPAHLPPPLWPAFVGLSGFEPGTSIPCRKSYGSVEYFAGQYSPAERPCERGMTVMRCKDTA